MILLFILLLVVVFYFYSTKNYDYWSKRLVKNEPPIPFFGNHFKVLFHFETYTEKLLELYNKYPNESVVGYFRGTAPALIIRDPNIIRSILSSNFSQFYVRGIGRHPEQDALSANLFNAEGDLWKLIRQKLTPAFTTAKLRSMFPLIIHCAEKLQILLKSIAENGGKCNVRDVTSRFTMEFIGACGFGIDTDTINNEHSLFRDLGKKIMTRPPLHQVKLYIYETFTDLRPFLYVGKKGVEDIIFSMVKHICEQRNNKPSGRNDFIDLLLELDVQEKLYGESIEKVDSTGKPAQVEIDFTFKRLAAQAFFFFAAGFETSSLTSSWTLHELAYRPDIQENVQNQIDEVLSNYDNKLCYDAISKMTLLEQAFKEAMRIFPPVGVLNRECTKEFTIPELNLTVKPGVKILIPVQALHMDEKFYDNPTEFTPERFSPEEMKKRHKYVYLPFGEGPRACIGNRLGVMQSLAGLAAILHMFSVEPSEHSQRHPTINKNTHLVQDIQGGLPLKLKLRKTTQNNLL